jgi:hypothetical protein
MYKRMNKFNKKTNIRAVFHKTEKKISLFNKIILFKNLDIQIIEIKNQVKKIYIHNIPRNYLQYNKLKLQIKNNIPPNKSS